MAKEFSTDNLEFRVLEDENEISNTQGILLDLLRKQSSEIENFKIYLPGPLHDSFEIFWFKEYDIWCGHKILEEKNKKHHNVFGKGKLRKIKYGNPNKPDYEINFPISGYNKRLGGAFLSDQEGNLYLSFNGNVGGIDDYGMNRLQFETDFKKLTKFQLIQEKKGRELFLISKIDDTLLQNISQLTHEIHSIKYGEHSPYEILDNKFINAKQVLDNLTKKGITKTHIQILKKFLVLKDQIIKDSSKIRGEKGISKIPADTIVSEPHYLHNLVRGVYKPEGDDYAQSIQTNPESKWGTEIDFETGNWKINYDFGESYKFQSDIESLRKCYDDDIPFGVIFKPRKGVNQILGLGKISNVEGSRFEIIPFHIDQKVEKIEEIAKDYASAQIANRDFSAQGSESTIFIRAKQQAFREILLKDYNTTCALCGFNIEAFLNAAHIVPFKIMRKEDEKNAMDPCDGILLCRLCDIAFENGEIQILPNLEIKITDNLKDKSSTNLSVKSWLSNIGNKICIQEGSLYKPDPKYLQRKNELISSKN